MKAPFGQVGIELGYLTPEQVDEALRIQHEQVESGQRAKLIGVILVELGYLRPAGVVAILDEMDRRAREEGR